MSVADESLAELKKQIAAGFKISKCYSENNLYHFVLSALEYDHYSISIPDGDSVQAFLASPQFKASLLVTVKVAVALLDIVGFSSQPDEVQLKMIVRYQCLVRNELKGAPLLKLISIGDGTIFVFDALAMKEVAARLLAIDNALVGFNLDFQGDKVPQIQRRIGVHVGNAYIFKDINGEDNYIGTGVNLAQRVSTCVPDPGQKVPFELNSTIYVSQAARDAFMAAGIGKEIEFHDAGDQTVKKTHVGHVFAMRKATKA